MAVDAGDVRASLILNIKQFLRGLRSAEDATEQLGETIGEETESIRDRFRDSFEGMNEMSALFGAGLATAGAKIGGALLGITNDFKNTEKSLRSFEAQTGITGKELDDFKGKIEETYLKGYGEDIQEVSDLYSSFQRELKLSADETEKLSNKAFQLQNLYQYDTSDSLRAVSSLMKNMGINGEKAFDLITKTAQVSGDASEDLLDTVAEYTPRFKEAGISSQAMFQILQKGVQAGARNYDVIGDSVKEFNILLTEGGDSAEEALSKIVGIKEAKKIMKDVASGTLTTGEAMIFLTDEIAKMDNKTEQANVATALFGTLWEEVGLKGLQAMTNIDQSTDNYTGTLDKASETLEGQGKTMEQVRREFEQFTNMLGSELAPRLSEMLTLASKVITKLLEFSKANPIFIKIIAITGTLITVLGTLAGAIIAIGAFITPIVAGFTFLGSVISTVIAVVGALVAGIVSAPVLIGAAIIGLVALIILKWDEIKKFTINTWTTIKNFILNVPDLIKMGWVIFVSYMLKLWNDFKTKSIQIWNGFLNFIKSVPGKLLNFFTSTLPFLIGYIIGRFVKLTIEAGKTIKNFFTSTLPNLINRGWAMAKQAFIVYIPQLISKIVSLARQLKNKFNQIRIDMGNKANEAIKAVIKYFSQLPAKIASYSGKVYNKSKNLGKKMIDGLKNQVKNLPKTVETAIKNAINGIGRFGSRAYSKMKSFGGSMWNGFKKGLGISSPSYIEEAMFAIGDESKNLQNNLFKTFRRMQKLDKINSMAEIAKNQAKGSPTTNDNRTIQNFNSPLLQILGENETLGRQTAYSLYDLITYNKRAMGVNE